MMNGKQLKPNSGGHEWLVMPFGHSNTPIMFIWSMNHVLKPFIEWFFIYLDDISIYNCIRTCYSSEGGAYCMQRKLLYLNLKRYNFMTDNLVYWALWWVLNAFILMRRRQKPLESGLTYDYWWLMELAQFVNNSITIIFLVIMYEEKVLMSGWCWEKFCFDQIKSI